MRKRKTDQRAVLHRNGLGMAQELDCLNSIRLIPGVHRAFGKVIFVASCPEAKKVSLRLYKSEGKRPAKIVDMQPVKGTFGLFTATLDESEAVAKEYLYDVDGRLQVDPYARRVLGSEVFGNGSQAKRAVVDFGTVSMADDRLPGLSFAERILYELQVRAFTMHSSSGVKDKGTYLGLVHKLPYLKSLGVSTVLLLPAVEFEECMVASQFIGKPADLPEDEAVSAKVISPGETADAKYKVNLWGFGARSYPFAPKASFASKPESCVDEFKQMILAFHRQGLEVFMDMDLSKCAPSMRLEVLRFWHTEYHVDGFRLIAGQLPEFMYMTDPVLAGAGFITNSIEDAACWKPFADSRKRLALAEDSFLYNARKFNKSDENMLKSFKDSFCAGGPDYAIVNYFTSHNGFTLNDLYSFDERHNEANGERGRDGSDYNCSWNCGAEGETKSTRIQKLRIQMIKNAFAAMLLGQGTPLLLAGDEMLNTQQGNNNAYCQDNEISWVVWGKSRKSRQITDFVKSLIELRKSSELIGRDSQLKGCDYCMKGSPDVAFHGLRPWAPDFGSYSRMMGVELSGKYASKTTKSLYIAFNMHWEKHTFHLPGEIEWVPLTYTCEQEPELFGEWQLEVPARSVVVLQTARECEDIDES